MKESLKQVTSKELDEMLEKAAASPRLRSHLNVHRSLGDPIQRLLIAVKSGSYFRPHKHVEKFETLLVLRGEMDALIFDDNGALKERISTSSSKNVVIVEIPNNTWHTLVPMSGDVVFFETKPGPYDPSHPADFAEWAPEEKPGSSVMASFLEKLEDLKVGESVQDL